MTLDLIATNVYNSVKAPTKRGFSYIEIWMLGIQTPILIGIFEYGTLLAMKRYHQNRNTSEKNNVINVISSTSTETKNDDEKHFDFIGISKMLDLSTFLFSFLFIVVFNIIYWSTVMVA